MKVLLIGDTGTGKTVTSLTLSKHFKTLYYDVDLGTELWLKPLDIGKNVRIVPVRDWNDFKSNSVERFVGNKMLRPDMVVVDSISELYEKYKDYVQDYVRKTGKFPMPTGTGVVDLTRKGIDVEFVTLPMQMYALLYDTILNVVVKTVSYTDHAIITMHPLETRIAVSLENGSSQVIHSSGKLSFLQGIYRKVDVILKLRKPMQAKVLKARGELKPPEELVDPVEYLKEKLGVGGDGQSG